MSEQSPTAESVAYAHDGPDEKIAFVVMAIALLVAPLAIYPFFLMQALCIALFACAFNLLVGYVGLLSFGHAMFSARPPMSALTPPKYGAGIRARPFSPARPALRRSAS